jgi:hypothetical protein
MKLLLFFVSFLISTTLFADSSCRVLLNTIGTYDLVQSECYGPGKIPKDLRVEPFGDRYQIWIGGIRAGGVTTSSELIKCTTNENKIFVETCFEDGLGCWDFIFSNDSAYFKAKNCLIHFKKIPKK